MTAHIERDTQVEKIIRDRAQEIGISHVRENQGITSEMKHQLAHLNGRRADEDDRNHQAEDEAEIDEAAEAFASLRQTVDIQGRYLGAEITVIRRGIEAAFEQFEKFQQPTDYSEDLARTAEGILLVAKQIAEIERSPILKNGPEYYAWILERSAESAMRIPRHPVREPNARSPADGATDGGPASRRA